MEETAPIWYILTGDRIRLDGEEFRVLDKKKKNSSERSWQFFRWNDEVARIYH